MAENKLTKRTPYLDYLRVLACAFIVLLHTASQNWSAVEASGSAWAAMNLYNGLARFGVFAFILISGALMVGRDIPIRTILLKYILRLLIAYFAWGILYALYEGGGWHAMVKNVINGYYHMWYIPMTIGLYLSQPVLHQVAQKKKVLAWFVLLCVIFAYAVPSAVKLANDFGGETAAKLADLGNGFIKLLHINMFVTFAGSFGCGYLLSKADLSRRQRGWLYALGILGVLLTVLLNYLSGLKAGEPVSTWLDNFCLNILAYAVGVFVWFRYHLNREGRLYPLVRRLSGYSFGAYLVHPLVLDLLKRAGLDSLSFTPWLSVPVIAAAVFCISMGVSALLHMIPGVRKYCV